MFADALVPPEKFDTDAQRLLHTSRSSAKLSANALSVGFPGADMTFASSDAKKSLHVHIATVLPSSIVMVDRQPGPGGFPRAISRAWRGNWASMHCECSGR